MSEKLKTHKDLDAWKWSVDLVETIYKATKVFPDGAIRIDESTPQSSGLRPVKHCSPCGIDGMYYVYVLQSEAGRKLYVGYTGDLRERLRLHNAGRVESTQGRRPLKLVYSLITHHFLLTVLITDEYQEYYEKSMELDRLRDVVLDVWY